MPRVLNLLKEGRPRGSVYIGRPSVYGNPFILDVHGTREEVIKKYEDWVVTQPDMIYSIKKELKGKDLVCFCAPLPCHGDILLKIANEDQNE